MASNSKSVAISCLLLRLLTLGLLAASIVLVVTDNVTFNDGDTTTFRDLFGYRYVLATSCVGALYTLLQIPFAIYLVITEKITESTKRIIDFGLFGDKVLAYVLASGVGAGFFVTKDTREIINDLGDDIIDPEALPKFQKYFDRGNLSTILLLVGFACMATTSTLSYVMGIKEKRKGIFG